MITLQHNAITERDALRSLRILTIRVWHVRCHCARPSNNSRLARAHDARHWVGQRQKPHLPASSPEGEEELERKTGSLSGGTFAGYVPQTVGLLWNVAKW